jgi:predicted methyltransferase
VPDDALQIMLVRQEERLIALRVAVDALVSRHEHEALKADVAEMKANHTKFIWAVLGTAMATTLTGLKLMLGKVTV